MAWRPLQVCLSTTTGCFDSSVLMQEEVTTACPLRLVRRVTLCKYDGKHCRWHSATCTLCYSNSGGLITYCIALFGHFDASLQQLRSDCSTKNMEKPRTSKCMILRLPYTSSLTGFLTGANERGGELSRGIPSEAAAYQHYVYAAHLLTSVPR
ncbi:hypothetical protein T01_12942 [Trichinella spiralis]|uniref:Uncharacterized protein n=1 Tax=Trichinella spiralis TaxID=6334 RepID=A0A0V1AWZ8_TRISP|nr:hypothetical protein T01_12942 [Trichinella spiralis]